MLHRTLLQLDERRSSSELRFQQAVRAVGDGDEMHESLDHMRAHSLGSGSVIVVFELVPDGRHHDR